MPPVPIHPPCTPAPSCQPTPRCHPSLPACSRPERCLRRSRKKGRKPCPSAVSIMHTRARTTCSDCRACKDTYVRRTRKVRRFLRTKAKESRLKRYDRMHGTRRYEFYRRRQGTKLRRGDPCCQGKGHRGRMQKRRCCTIL